MTRLMLSALLILLVAGFIAVPVLAQSPDPAPSAPAANSGSPLLGVLVLGAPAVFMVWRSWHKKKLGTRAST